MNLTIREQSDPDGGQWEPVPQWVERLVLAAWLTVIGLGVGILL